MLGVDKQGLNVPGELSELASQTKEYKPQCVQPLSAAQAFFMLQDTGQWCLRTLMFQD